ncbi:MAG TPA: ribonuclease PH [Verrucomicrobia bacterium]|nr:MAG: ribonuclease PH [Lentisphaerae bacterium GWF2_57_35]HBA82858.1 ribonuclease PH [Verrucomicrobiota bacterium]
MKSYSRPDGRRADQIRPVRLEPGIAPAATGSVLVCMGHTQVICAVTVEESVPRWMKEQKVRGGWITAEYSMLPYAATQRNKRESTSGKVGGRTQEIQRLIGRSLRAIVDLDLLGSRTLWLDCDVLQADGGTRTASITGAYAALRLAVDRCLKEGRLEADPIREPLAAVSVGVVEGHPLLDLCYIEDVAAEVDMNIVMTASGKMVEIQGTAESQPFSVPAMNRMLTLAKKGIRELLQVQQKA